jgi:TonB-dependent starch-binding outer membrane protein SusC
MQLCLAGRLSPGKSALNQELWPTQPAARFRTNRKTIFRALKLTSILLFIACLQVSAHTTAQKLSITVKNGSLESLFTTIEQKTGFTVFYNVSDLQHAKPVTIDVKDASVEEVLQLSLKNQALTYFIQEKTIFIKKEVSKFVSDAATPGEETPPTFSGVVKSETGIPLAGATVYISKLKKSVTTGAKGEFALKNVPDGVYDVEISFVGYATYKTAITVKNHSGSLTAALKQSTSQLDETVVKGYYTTSERLNTGDVTTVKGETINEQPVTDPILALEGRVPGLYIQQTTGAPGAYSSISIMGQNSIANGNDPLYIVDGVPFSSVSLSSTSMIGGAIPEPGSNISNSNGGGLSPLNNLNPADIESIEVLKDADATAIYGSRGANGVILITTKKGKAGSTKLDLNVYNGVGTVTREMHLLNTNQYLEMRREAFQNDGLSVPSIVTDPTDNNYDVNGLWDTSRHTNWQKVLIDNPSKFTNAQASVSGGNASTQFLVGGGYSKQSTVFIGNFYDQKVSTHINLTHASVDQRFHLQVGANYTYDDNYLPSLDFTNFITLAPDAPALYKADGSINWAIYNGTATFQNPAAVTLRSSKASSNNLISNINLSYQLLPGLQLKTNLGYNKEEMNQTYLSPATATAPPNNTNPNRRITDFANTAFTTWIIEPQMDYQHRIGPGQFQALAGSTFQQNIHNSITQYALGFTSDALISDPLAASIFGYQGTFYSMYRYDAIYGRLSYNISDKYIVNLTARRDGSSRFGPGKQFGNFGSAGIGWIFTKERFVENDFSFFSFGKLRASYGTTGNDEITDYQYLSTYSPIAQTYEGVGGLYPTRLTNPYFAWEVVKKLEGGLDLGFLKDRILIAATYYRNRTGNQLVGELLPEVTGFSVVQFNLPAVVQNSGAELSMKTTNIKAKFFSWTTSANLTIPSSKLVAFPTLNNFPQYATKYIVGKSIFINQEYHNTGVDPQTGLYSFETKNAGGIPSAPQDLVATKPITQKIYGGIQNSLSYKGVQFDIFIQYVNQLGYNYSNYFGYAGQANFNQPTAALDRWTKSGNISAIQRFGTSGSTVGHTYSYFQSSDRVITDASFLRLKNLALSYKLSDTWNKKMHLQSFKIYLQCQNLFTITKYLGLDPETQGLALPPLRMVTGGVQVNL